MKIKSSQRIRPRNLGKNERALLEAVSGTDILVGFLLSSHSTRRMLRIAAARSHARGKTQADERHRLIRAARALQKKGLLQLFEDADDTRIHITTTGLQELTLARPEHHDPKMWDGKWRIILFDIPSTHTTLRLDLRRILERIGFLRLQQSVYVFPYDSKHLTQSLARRTLPLSQVTYCTVEHIEHDDFLRKHFKLHSK